MGVNLGFFDAGPVDKMLGKWGFCYVTHIVIGPIPMLMELAR